MKEPLLQIILFFTFALLQTSLFAQATQVTDFGDNPGNLEMYLFQPSAPRPDAEVVLVLHGCGQSALNFAEQTGWNVLAEQYGFYVVFAQQKTENNTFKCFNWFLPSDNNRGSGEAASMAAMVTYVHENFSTDNTKSFVCGLSGGGAMTPVMMACYPDIFKSGGTWAGVPYKYRPSGNNTLTPAEWGDKVREAFPAFTGTYPTLFVCQGTDDDVTPPISESLLVAQWTNVHGADQEADATNTAFLDNSNVEENIYLDSDNDTIVKTYTISGMGHGVAVDPGTAPFQGGQTSPGSFDVDFFSTYWMARFFGIIDDEISSTTEVDTNSKPITTSIRTDGSLSVNSGDISERLQLNVFGVSGRLILQEQFYNQLVVPARKLRGRKIVLATVVNKKRQRLHSQVLIRR